MMARLHGPGRAGLLGAALLGVALALTSPGIAAFADTTTGGLGDDDSTGGSTKVVNRCVLYANTSGFGADCVGGDSGRSIKQILGGEKFPECRFEPLPADANPPREHLDEKGTWYLKNCLKGIKDDGTGDFTYTTEFKWIPDGTDVPVLTPNQLAAWNVYRSTYPKPLPQFGPAAQPRVLIPTYFWLTGSTGSNIDHTVFDGTRDVLMRARVERIDVTPGAWKDDTTIHCPGPGVPYDFRKGLFAQDSNCSYEYPRSSAVSADRQFSVIVDAYWVVEYMAADGTMQRLGRFPLSRVTKTAVDEIQTVVG